jgi:hypothetical protein
MGIGVTAMLVKDTTCEPQSDHCNLVYSAFANKANVDKTIKARKFDTAIINVLFNRKF